MIRQLIPSLVAFLLTLLVLGGGVPPAQAETLRYRAEAATPQKRVTLIVNDVVWKCGLAGCVAARSNSRPVIDCSALAREVGALRSFAVAGRSLSPPELEKCNARAR